MLKTHLTFVIMLFIALCLGGGGEQPVHPSLISNTDGMRLLITPSRDKKQRAAPLRRCRRSSNS